MAQTAEPTCGAKEPAPAKRTVPGKAEFLQLSSSSDRKRHGRHHHHAHDSAELQTQDEDDILEDNEEKEIMESIKYAENQLGKKMQTPVPMKEHPWSPITYDVEQNMVGTKIEHGTLTNLIETSNDIRLDNPITFCDTKNVSSNSTATAKA